VKLPALRRSSWALLAASALLHLGLLVGWRWQLPLVPYFFDATVLSGGRGLDFYSIYQAGHNARHGLDIYEGDPARVPVVVPYFTPYRYLPVVAYTVGAGLSLLPPLTAYKLWVVVVELALLGCVAATYAVTRRDPDLFARLAMMWLVFSPYYLELFMGQFSLVQAALVWGMMVVALNGRDFTGARWDSGGDEAAAGLSRETSHSLTQDSGGDEAAAGRSRETSHSLAQDSGGDKAAAGRSRETSHSARRGVFDGLWVASVLWKITTVLFVPLLARLGRWRAIVAAGVLGVVLTLPYFVVFPAHWADFVRNNAGGRVAGHELGNLGLRQLVYQALAMLGAPAGLQQSVQLAVVAAVLAVALWVTWRSRRHNIVAGLALWLVVFFLVSPQVWEHHYLMLLPALVGLYAQRRSRVVLLVWGLLALPTPFGFIGLQPVIAANHDLRAFALEPAWQPLLQHASKAVPALALFVYAARQVGPAPAAWPAQGRAVGSSPPAPAPNDAIESSAAQR
jgi:hypothetical protein